MWRGEIWWASLPGPSGSDPGYRRPVLIIQSDAFNQSRINTRIVAVLTSNLKLAEAPGNVRLTAKTTGLPRDSVVNVSQLLTLDKSFLTKRVTRLNTTHTSRIENGLRLVLGL